MKNGARAGGGNDPCAAKGAMAPSLPTRECEKDYNKEQVEVNNQRGVITRNRTIISRFAIKINLNNLYFFEITTGTITLKNDQRTK